MNQPGGRATAVLALVLLMGTASARTGVAQEKPKEQPQPEEQKKAPEAGGEVPKAPEPAAKPAAVPPVNATAGPDGFFLQAADGGYRLQANAILQVDGRFFTSDTARLDTDSFLLRSARPILQGTVAGRFDVYMAPDFGQGQSLIQDAYLDARCSPSLRFRVGKFKTPFGLERLQSEGTTLFVERALPTDIAPNRDVGLQLSGDVSKGVFSWAAAFLNGVPDGGSGDLATGDSKEGAVRGFLRPFRAAGGPLRGLGLGLAATFGRMQGTLPVYRTTGQVVFFNYVPAASADGHQTRLSPQANFYSGPVGLVFEYVRSTQKVRKDPAVADVTNQAWQVAASWLITGDTATPSWVTPRRPFDPGKGQWGAFELAARVHQLKIGADAFDLGFADIKKSARQATAWGVDLNWYLNRNVKYVVNFEQTKFEGGAVSGNRETETVLFFRAQVAF